MKDPRFLVGLVVGAALAYLVLGWPRTSTRVIIPGGDS